MMSTSILESVCQALWKILLGFDIILKSEINLTKFLPINKGVSTDLGKKWINRNIMLIIQNGSQAIDPNLKSVKFCASGNGLICFITSLALDWVSQLNHPQTVELSQALIFPLAFPCHSMNWWINFVNVAN